MGLTWVAPSLDGCAAGAVGWFGAGGAEEPGATVDGGLRWSRGFAEFETFISEPESCVCLQRGVEKKDDILL